MSKPQLRYVLVTPARNEEAFIEMTIKSMITQTLRPEKWVVVSDGSTDRTDEIVKKYTAQYDWIELVRMPERKERDFGGKVLCFNAGRERVACLPYDLIGNLDADLTFESDLFELLICQFSMNPKLGVGGAPFTEGKGTYDFRYSSIEHVSGACQLFRRECFDEIGGYKPMKGGGIDVLAVLTARMKGWQTRSFPERVCFHHRTMGSAKDTAAGISYRLGQKDYMLGRHPIWQLFRSLYQMRRAPVFVGGIMLLAGYCSFALARVKRMIPEDVIQFQRREQMARLKKHFTRRSSQHTSPNQSYVENSHADGG
jgi:poly-beta-1,6-N-acetyl-D-glucosamine synthase